MGTVLSISPRDRKMVVYTDSNNTQPGTGFSLNTFNYSEHLNNVKNKDKVTNHGSNLNNNNHHLDAKHNILNSHNNSNNGHHNGLKKSSIFINALNLGKHFSVSSKKKNKNQEKDKEKDTNKSKRSPLVSINNLVDNNKNIQKSLSCYNLKSGITTNNIEVVKNLNRNITQEIQAKDEDETLFKRHDKSNHPTITLSKPTVPPPVPPKPTILLSKNSIRPSCNGFLSQQNNLKNGITLTNALVTNGVTKTGPYSPTSTHRKTVIQVSLDLIQ